MTTSTHDLISSVERARTSLLDAITAISEAEASRKPLDGGWSISENVEHLYLAEISGVTKMWAAAVSLRNGTAWTDARPNHGMTIEDVVATTWRAREIAPPIATPHIGGPLAVWISSLRSLRFVLADLERDLVGVNLEDIVFPHFLSGSLDGRQRLEFLRFHIERHHAQIERIRSKL